MLPTRQPIEPLPQNAGASPVRLQKNDPEFFSPQPRNQVDELLLGPNKKPPDRDTSPVQGPLARGGGTPGSAARAQKAVHLRRDLVQLSP